MLVALAAAALIVVAAVLTLRRQPARAVGPPTPRPTATPIPAFIIHRDSPPTAVRWTVVNPATHRSAIIIRAHVDTHGTAQDPAPAGTMFVTFEALIHNGSSTSGYYNALDFRLADVRGKSYNETTFFPGAADAELQGGNDNPPGGTKSGAIGFSVPTSTRTVTLTWSDGGKANPPLTLQRIAIH